MSEHESRALLALGREALAERMEEATRRYREQLSCNGLVTCDARMHLSVCLSQRKEPRR